INLTISFSQSFYILYADSEISSTKNFHRSFTTLVREATVTTTIKTFWFMSLSKYCRIIVMRWRDTLMTDKIYDMTIIGAGPAGLFTAFYGGMRQASVKIIESLPHTGGQLTALYTEKNIYNVAGFPKIRAQELVYNLEEQEIMYDPTIVLDQAIEKVERLEDGTLKLTSNKEVHYTKTVIITAGNGAFQPRRLNVGECDQFEGINLHYHVKDMNQYKDQHVMLLGGGDSAVDWALMLEPIAKQVSLVHRRYKFRANENSVEMLKSSNVNILTPYATTEIFGEDKVERVILQEVKGKNKIDMEVDSILCNYGFISTLGTIKDWG